MDIVLCTVCDANTEKSENVALSLFCSTGDDKNSSEGSVRQKFGGGGCN